MLRVLVPSDCQPYEIGHQRSFQTIVVACVRVVGVIISAVHNCVIFGKPSRVKLAAYSAKILETHFSTHPTQQGRTCQEKSYTFEILFSNMTGSQALRVRAHINVIGI